MRATPPIAARRLRRARPASPPRREEGVWRLTLRDETSGDSYEISARALVNAAGPWVGDVLHGVVGVNARSSVRLVKGSHIVTERLFDHDRCYIFQNADGRILFVIPYERDFTLIGTTDLDYSGDPGAVAASEEEIDYLCKATSDYFRKPVTRDQVKWSYSGVRPLFDDGASAAQAATRDYVLKIDAAGRRAGAAERVRRQDHNLSETRGIGDRHVGAASAARRRKPGVWTANVPAARRRFRGAGFRGARRGIAGALSRVTTRR